jgi:hypothetical protein
VRTPPLAAVLVFVALLTALTMLRGALRSDAQPERLSPQQQSVDHHPPRRSGVLRPGERGRIAWAI